MRIGVLGGTFDPVHIGHLVLAEEAVNQLGLDRLIFVPTNQPPHKDYSPLADAEDRFIMAKLAVEDNPSFEVSRVEIDRPGKSYSVETLKQLKEEYGPEAEIFLLTGSDSLEELSSWRQIDEVLRLCRFVVAGRPGYPLKNLPPGAGSISITPVNVSSTEIRRRIEQGESIRELLPDKVRKYILEKGLYVNVTTNKHE